MDSIFGFWRQPTRILGTLFIYYPSYHLISEGRTSKSSHIAFIRYTKIWRQIGINNRWLTTKWKLKFLRNSFNIYWYSRAKHETVWLTGVDLSTKIITAQQYNRQLDEYIGIVSKPHQMYKNGWTGKYCWWGTCLPCISILDEQSPSKTYNKLDQYIRTSMINFTHLQQEQFLPSYRIEEFVSKTDDRFK